MWIGMDASGNTPALNAESVPRLLTVVEVADVLGVCTETVYRAIWNKKLRSVRLGRAVRVRVDHLRSYVESHGR